MTVRIATPDDADAIERVRTDTWRATYRGAFPDAVLDGLTYDGTRRRQRIIAMTAQEFVLVAEHDRAVVGFVNGGPSRVGDPAHPGEIYAIYVLPAHQGHGHGSSLMRAGAREIGARGWRGMLLWVLRENAPSRLFYERMGGRQLHDREEQVQGVTITESGYAWDDIGALATTPGRGRGDRTDVHDHRHGTPWRALRNFLDSDIPLPRRVIVVSRNVWLRVALRQTCCGHDGEPGC